MGGRWRAVTATMVVCLLASACGSTVQAGRGGDPVAAGQDDAGLWLDPDTGLDMDSPNGRGSTSGLGGATGAGQGSASEPSQVTAGAEPTAPQQSGAGAGTAESPASSAPASPPQQGQSSGGDDAQAAPEGPIRIGYVTTDTAGFDANLGGGDSFSGGGDTNRRAERQEMEALVRFANETGGVGGRQIEAVEFPVALAQLDPAYTERICIAAAEDHGVSAMIDRSYLNFEEAMHCFASRGITLVGIQSTLTDRATFHGLRPYVASSWPTLDRIGQVMVRGMAEAGWFQDATVGVVLDDSPSIRRVYDEHILPAMRQLGSEPLETVYVSASSTEPSTAEVSSAVLRFRTQGVTHVFNLLSLVNFIAFQTVADSQGYRPRYGFGDYSAGASGAVGFGMPAQNHGAIAVSVDPRAVIDSPDSPGWSGQTQGRPADTPENTTAGQRRCLDILSEYTGNSYYGASSATGASLSYRWYCDHFLLWLDAARQAGATVTPGTWGDGLGALGDDYASPLVYRTQFSPGRFDGASAYRIGQYDRACQCFIGQGPWRDFPW